MDKLEEIRARHRASSVGPYRWRGNSTGNTLHLWCEHGARKIVMAFFRWGMQGALPAWNVEGMMRSDLLIRPEEHNPWKITGVDHPDAVALERSWEDREWLLNEVDYLRGMFEGELRALGHLDEAGG